MVIGVIAFMPLAMPFVAERSFWRSGSAKAESQRDAQLVLRAMARAARESTSYTLTPDGGRVQFATPDCPAGSVAFEVHDTAELHWHTCDGDEVALVDGARSQVVEFTVTRVTTRLLHVRLHVIYDGRDDEILETQLHLRNAA